MTPARSISCLPIPLHAPLTPPSSQRLSCTASAPHTLEEPVLLGKAVEGIVRLGARAHEAAERVDLVLARVAAVLVDLADADLHAGVVLGFDDAVCCAALAGDIAVKLCVSLGSDLVSSGGRVFVVL
jgi:hypothetical protein